MRDRLKEKYVLVSFQERLMDQLHSLRQGNNINVTEYMNKFEELTIRCGVIETVSQQVSRFRSGLKPELKRE